MSQNIGGSSNTAAGMREDMREMKGEAAAGAERISEDAREELARLRAQVEKLMQERVTPALAGAAETVEDYAARARSTIEQQADALSSTVRERPLMAVGIAALAGFLIGRLTGGTTYVYSSDRR